MIEDSPVVKAPERSGPVKAVCLLSGGLDSALALSIVKDQGVSVLAVNFSGPFGGCTEERSSAAHQVASGLGVPLEVIMLGQDYLEMVKAPRYGYGSNVNPCIDCHIYMLRGAGRVMAREGASFVVTGEVLGQRPMSQRLDTLRKIEKASGLAGLILRPLSAKMLEETVPEARGWVRREDMLGISGRSRREQLSLAREKGLVGYSTPAGGCLLTDPKFAQRVRDLLARGCLSLEEARLLRMGRHFRLAHDSKLVVGRNQAENDRLAGAFRSGQVLLVTEDCPGPTAILEGVAVDRDLEAAVAVVARYSDGRSRGSVRVAVVSPGGRRSVTAAPMDAAEVEKLMI
ncbi:MAG: 7-cyano-7-deazaguanine synthase [bacterium]